MFNLINLARAVALGAALPPPITSTSGELDFIYRSENWTFCLSLLV